MYPLCKTNSNGEIGISAEKPGSQQVWNLRRTVRTTSPMLWHWAITPPLSCDLNWCCNLWIWSANFRTLMAVSFLSMDLSNNLLTAINPFPYTEPPVLNQRGTILERLNLQGNPLKCDCYNFDWHSKWLGYMRSHLSDQQFNVISADWNNTSCRWDGTWAQGTLGQFPLSKLQKMWNSIHAQNIFDN